MALQRPFYGEIGKVAWDLAKSPSYLGQTYTLPKAFLSGWAFIEKTSVRQSMKHKVCSNFQMSFLHLSQMDPQVEASHGQEWY